MNIFLDETILYEHNQRMGFPHGSVVKNLPAKAGDAGDRGLNPGLGRSPGKGNGKPLQYSCLHNPWREEPGRLQFMRSQSQM